MTKSTYRIENIKIQKKIEIICIKRSIFLTLLICIWLIYVNAIYNSVNDCELL